MLGIDHIVAMIAIGVWGSQHGGMRRWLIPLAFVIVMSLGGVLGSIGSSPSVAEAGIIASVLALGFLIAASARPSLPVAIAIAGLFALFHGVAHGMELPVGASGLLYGLGFIAATAFLHLAGIGLGTALERRGGALMPRIAGAAIIVVGLTLVVARAAG